MASLDGTRADLTTRTNTLDWDSSNFMGVPFMEKPAIRASSAQMWAALQRALCSGCNTLGSFRLCLLGALKGRRTGLNSLSSVTHSDRKLSGVKPVESETNQNCSSAAAIHFN